LEAQNYIHTQNGQLKKIICIKTRQSMVLTDTPGIAFVKISMDIVGPFPTTESGHSYILTIQDFLTKYLVAVPLKQATSSEIAEALVENVYQLAYRAESIDYRSRPEFHKQNDASYST